MVTLLVGHSESRRGAKNFKGEHEWEFNSRIARKVYELLDKRIDVLFKGITPPYEKILEETKPELVIELHFNYFGGRVTGCEALIINEKSYPDANNLLHLISSRFGLRNRGVREVTDTDRGFLNLRILEKYSNKCILLEPCFQNDREIFNNEDAYALLLADFLEQYLPVQKTEEKPWTKLLASLWALLPYSKDSLKTKIPYKE